jgi:transposase
MKHKFINRWIRHKDKDEFWVYDTTSISSYSKLLKQIQYGYNKENDKLEQLNLSVVFGEKSNLPFYYRKLSGNIPDSKTIKQLLLDLEQFKFDKLKLVLDRGFYSKDNISSLLHKHLKFIISTKKTLSIVKDNLSRVSDIVTTKNLIPQYDLYASSVTTNWEYNHNGKKIRKRIYLHYYYNTEQAAYDKKELDKKLLSLKEELLQGKHQEEYKAFYDRCFIIKETPKGIKVDINTKAVNETKDNYGYFVLLTNQKLSSKEVLELYRNKDVVEKAFNNLKERLNLRRLLVSNEQSLEGKLFVEFIALILMSYIKKQMQDKNLFKTYTIQTLLDKLDVIECYRYPNKKLQVGEILQKQKEIYEAFEIEIPQ